VLGDLLLRAVGEAGIGDGVAAVAVGEELQDGRLAVAAGVLQELRGGLQDRLQVVAVDPLAAHAVGAGPLVELGLGGGAVDARAHAVDVVHDDVDDRQPPDAGEVQRLVPGADVRRAVAELAQHRLLAAVARDRERDAGGDGQLPADDAPAAQEVASDVEQVHGPAAAVRAAVDAAEQLGHDGAGAHAAREREAVVAVGGEQVVVVAHRGDGADRRGLLAGGQVAVAADAGLLVLALRFGLELPDEHHELVEGEEVVVGHAP
jgi:hypothetical protein